LPEPSRLSMANGAEPPASWPADAIVVTSVAANPTVTAAAPTTMCRLRWPDRQPFIGPPGTSGTRHRILTNLDLSLRILAPSFRGVNTRPTRSEQRF
jgi:hypothetical protein